MPAIEIKRCLHGCSCELTACVYEFCSVFIVVEASWLIVLRHNVARWKLGQFFWWKGVSSDIQ